MDNRPKAPGELSVSFKRGDVFYCELAKEPTQPSYVMEGPHRVVVLTDSIFPKINGPISDTLSLPQPKFKRFTVPVLPITSLHDDEGQEKKKIPTDLVLYYQDYAAAGPPYNTTITKDSLIRTEQIISISRNRLERKVGALLPEDLKTLDLLLLLTLKLEDTVQQMIDRAVNKALAPYINYEDGTLEE